MSVRSLVVKPPSHPTYDLKGFIQLALSEDAGDRGDVTCKATVPAEMEMEAEAHFLAKEDGIEAGIALAKKVFGEVDPSLKRMSGIATLTKAMADAARPAYILETRKTAPGLRLVDKWAVS